jgi:hypothetical protein
VSNQVGRVRQTGAVMTGNAMKKNGLQARVGQQVGGPRHLFERRA